ncbi:hypothetical protein [Cellulosimicrobium sp. Marseille-Q4280]|uniref:hypothetical protein n=1 Tax=Cellulosimicrobium sp. Marseille-Q4280 TaxID=2937992 RepID=UPI00203AAF60|nr:hypothetical protein [Cellulosimicrobium sp. Marseille-Q4280]
MTTLVAYDPRAWASWRALALGHVQALTAAAGRPEPDVESRTETILGMVAEIRELDLDATSVRLDLAEMALLTPDTEQAWPADSAPGTPGPGGWVDASALEVAAGLMSDLRELNDRVTDRAAAGPVAASWAAVQAAHDALAGAPVVAVEPHAPAAPEEFATWWAQLGTASALMAGWNATAFIENRHGKPWEPALDLRLRFEGGRVRVAADLQSYQFADFAQLMTGSTLQSVLMGLSRCADAGQAWAATRSATGLAAKARERGGDVDWWVGADPAFADLAPLVWSLLDGHGSLHVAFGPDATWTLAGPVEESGRGLAALRSALGRAWWTCRT